MREEGPRAPDRVRAAEVVGTLCLATDLGMGFPFEHGLRTALIADGEIHVQSGAGIVSDSVPESEYWETVNKANALWSRNKKDITPEQYEVTQHAGTERAFTGVYWDEKRSGTYRCVVCGLELFESDTKYESGSGWPSFWKPIDDDRVTLKSAESRLLVELDLQGRPRSFIRQ